MVDAFRAPTTLHRADGSLVDVTMGVAENDGEGRGIRVGDLRDLDGQAVVLEAGDALELPVVAGEPE